MGNDDLAVVDQELKVRGIDGLRVIDASDHAQADQRQHDGDVDDDR